MDFISLYWLDCRSVIMCDEGRWRPHTCVQSRVDAHQ